MTKKMKRGNDRRGRGRGSGGRGSRGGRRGRSGRGGRGRGVRTRGGISARGGDSTAVPNLWDVELTVEDITVGPVMEPLESPLHPKRRRNWNPLEEARSDAEPLWTPDAVPSTSWAPDAVPTALRSPALPTSPAPPDSPAFPPSPALYMECSTSATPQTVRRPRTHLAEDICLALENFGSEVDDDEEVEDIDFEPPINVCRRYISQHYSDNESDDDDQLPPVVISQVETATTTEADTVGPRDFYDFQWRAFTEPPISPELRRESFSSHQGPTAPNPDPYENFVSIWDREIMEYIAAETNAYAQQVAANMANSGTLQPKSRICFWKDVTVDELYVLFAIIIAMGSVIKGKITDYWNKADNIFSTPGFRVHKSLRRFEMLSACLHFNRNGNMPTDLDAGQAKLYKIQPILNHLNSKFQSLYDLSQNIALDESLLKWSGWLSINQFIPNKAARMGIKSYEVCESQTGYLWRFEIHTVKVAIPPSTDHVISRRRS